MAPRQIQPTKLLCLFIVCLVLLHGSNASNAAPPTVSTQRPPFLSHVTTEQLNQARHVAETRHQAAVQQALTNYPLSDSLATISDAALDAQTLTAYSLHCPGSIPDFATVIPSTVYVTDPPLLTADECAHVIASAEAHFQQTNKGVWPMQQSGQYHISGFYIHQVPKVKEWFIQTVQAKLFPLLARTFPDFVSSPLDLCVDNAYLFKYTPETGRRTDVHTDSGCLSFTIALNPSTDYTGGGTWFDGLSDTDSGVVSMNVGQVTIRPGGVKHCGYAVTSGTRYIIGGFCMHRNKAEHVRMLLQAKTEETASPQPWLEAATVLNPRCDAAYNLLAHHYESMGDTVKARHVLEYCLEHVHGSSGEIAYALGSIYLQQQLYHEAVRCMTICVSSDPHDVDAMMGLATASAALGDGATEERYYTEIVATPGANPTVVASAYCNLGVLHAGDDSEISYYQKCLDLLPHNYAARYSLACAHASRSEWSAAVSAFQQAVAALALDSSNDSRDQLLTTLQSLYTATAHVLQAQPAPASREEMMLKFQETMGADNYHRLVALREGR